jgi:hypothetical protein
MGEEHRIYKGVHSVGNALVPFGKCLCGVVMESDAEIEEHEKIIFEEART